MKTLVPAPPLRARHKNRPHCGLPRVAPTLTQPEAEVIARSLKALGDPTRLQMLDLLVQQTASLCECDFAPLFAQHQPTISYHLRVLRESGLVDTEKQGIWCHYWATALGRVALGASLTLLGKE